jgi:hypothetical protein
MLLQVSTEWDRFLVECSSQVSEQLEPTILSLAFVFLVVGYGTKVGLVPIHNWLPDAHSEGPTPISAVLSGLLLNIALYAATSRGMTYSVFCADDLIGRTMQDYTDNLKALPPQLVAQAQGQRAIAADTMAAKEIRSATEGDTINLSNLSDAGLDRLIAALEPERDSSGGETGKVEAHAESDRAIPNVDAARVAEKTA